MKRVAVFGLGYVGCVTAACLSRDGHEVVGVDVDPGKMAMVNAGETPIEEPGLGELVCQQAAAGRLRATSNVEEAVAATEMALIAVGTPSSEDGAVSSVSVEAVVESIGRALRGSNRRYGVVVRSTLLPGILEDRLIPLLEKTSGRRLGADLWAANNPEFLRESSSIKDYDNPPFVLVGADDPQAAEAVLDLYGAIDAEKIVVDAKTSAMVKYACNAFHALKVAFGNEIGALTRSFGGDGRKVMDLVCRDAKLNISAAYLRPGFAFGGSCLPKDLRAIVRYAEREGVRTPLLASVLPANQEQLQRGVRAVQEFGVRKLGMIGLSFKAGTDDLRESPLVELAETLLGRGYQLKIYDPGINITRLRGKNLAYVDQKLPHLAELLVGEAEEVFRHAEMLILGNNIADSIDWRGRFSGKVFDLRGDLATARSVRAD